MFGQTVIESFEHSGAILQSVFGYNGIVEELDDDFLQVHLLPVIRNIWLSAKPQQISCLEVNAER